MKKIILALFFLLSLILTPSAFAQNFISVVNPVRGGDFWENPRQDPATALEGQIKILKKANLEATWLLRYDALNNEKITSVLKLRPNDEKGLFLEVTPSLTREAKVNYPSSGSWHLAGSAFLTGYAPSEREKLIDVSFEKFKKTFGYYPSSAGAWWIDSHSLGYMKKKYGISAALIVSDQYSTDNYQIWGQYFSTPYYPAKNNTLFPAQTLESKLDVVVAQWAPRDPVNSYGNGVMESTFSFQANDYTDYHNLGTEYFSKLIDTYTKQKFNLFSHLVVGLENSYDWNKYSEEYSKQIEVIKRKKQLGELSVISLGNFARWYKSKFSNLSPSQIIITDDPLGSYKKSVWFMNPYYRAGWFFNDEGSVFRDIRQYIEGTEELCLKARCDSVNFATSATRVLDEVSFGHKWIIDKGKLSDFKVEKEGENFVLSYTNEGGNKRNIFFLPRDIGIDSQTFSIDTAILNAVKENNTENKISVFSLGNLNWSFISIISKLGKFLVFLFLALLVPGFLLTRKLTDNKSFLISLFLSAACGLASFPLIYYLTSLLNVKFLIYAYILLALVLFVKFSWVEVRTSLNNLSGRLNLPVTAMILGGTIFQAMPTFKSGLHFSYGSGFWGPNTHDGVWHIALINQLIRSVPPENPIFQGEALKNYHFFYDLLIAGTVYLVKLPVADLLFRFYPVIFSLMLGIGSYYLVKKLFEEKLGSRKTNISVFFALYLIYFAGSFGWIVEYLRERHFGGESAFWVNQSVSFNLNPPFTVSLVIMFAISLILISRTINRFTFLPLVIMMGTLASFKSYTGILALGAFLLVAVVRFLKSKDITLIFVTVCSALLSGWLFLSNFQADKELLVFAPFWFIHSMVDSPDRVGWVRLSLARTSSATLGQWPKFIMAEALSLALFIVGNLGVRILSFGLIFKIKEIFENEGLLFIFLVTVFSISIPVLFIQSGNPWNTIQFFYPALYINALFAGMVIAYLIFKLPKTLAVIFAVLVLGVGPINSLVTASGYLTDKPHAFISSKELEALDFLAEQPDGVVLTYPYDEKLKQKIAEPWPLFVYDSTAYVSAYSRKSAYLEDEPQNQILLTDYKKRLVASKDFFLKPLTQSKNFLQNNNIKYIYVPKIFNVSLENEDYLIKEIFENEETVVYKIN